MENRSQRILLLASLFVAGVAHLHAANSLRLVPDIPSPAPVGAMITWMPELEGSFSQDLWYRFRVREAGGTFRVVRDYGPSKTLAWTSIEEGAYEVELSVRDRTTGEVATAISTLELTSRVSNGQPVVSATTHPLVFLYSAPCDQGIARVRFEKAVPSPQYTPDKPCSAGRSVNFYLAGLTPATSYSATLEVTYGGETAPPTSVNFSTDDVFWDQPLPNPDPPGVDKPERVLLQSPLFLRPMATDLDGELIWFGPPDLSYLTNPAPGGTFWAIATSQTDPALDAVRQFDLVGMTVRETNAARINEQLALLGHRPISGFHHEARPLSGDRVVVLATVEQILTDVQGPGPVDVLGDMILVLDSNMQVVWAWDAFDHLDPKRTAILGQTCLAVVGCSSYYLAPDANDWTHGNSVAPTADGALLFSVRHQDWVLKIDFGNGSGSGEVIWRLGKDGDFQYESADPYPWFSHQHDAHPASPGSSTIVLFDNGNTRVSLGLGQTSRGQAIELDEVNRVARLRLNADLGLLAGALGSAQQLKGGDFHFNAGLVFDPATPTIGEAFSVETDPEGNVVSSYRLAAPVYRSFRLEDLYGAEPFGRRRPARTVGGV